jgi:hypothetical protein
LETDSLRTVLPAEECLSRLQGATTRWRLWPPPPEGTMLLLRVRHLRFRLSPSDGYRNGFALHFYGSLSAEGGGTVIRGRVRLPLGATLFFSGVAAMLIGVLSLSVIPGQLESRVVLLWVVLAVGLWYGVQQLAPRTRRRYMQFLEATLAATPLRGVAA